MQKPSDYDEVQVGGDYTPPELGGHHMIIKGVREEKSKSGKPMIVVAFDFAQNDKQPGYFADAFENDIRPDKKWPANGTMWIMTQDYQDPSKTSRNFKSFVTSAERSNNFTAEWGDKFCKQFTGKRIGGVFGIVEEEYNGKVSKRHKLRYFCEDAKVETAKIPQEKLLKEDATSGFTSIPEGSDEEVPF